MSMRQQYGAIFSVLLIAFLCVSDGSIAQEYVGTEKCAGCHEVEFKAWQNSHHDMAMRHAAPDSVAGNFNDIEFVSNDQTNRFFKKDDEYWVNIQGPDGDFHDYQIKYTFGFEPLQQYMVEFEDGRIQLIPFAWDSRDKQDGGQRWFNLYPEQTKKYQEFYWTNTGQNWNYMCADCHSTNVAKNFDVETNTYQTTFSEINVGCEGCHGPASKHIEWTEDPGSTKGFNGFERNLWVSAEEWRLNIGDTTMSPINIKHSDQNLVCAQCHSRHVQISTKDHVKSKAFGDRYLLNFIDSLRYYPDGQVFDEDYVYGSFLQSKMNANGVVCSNCHDPHTAKLILPKEKVCTQCHVASNYATPSHHHHSKKSEGAQCVSCHMPETTYMQIDARRDHGWHIPRPDFAKNHGTPDTCLSCHADQNSDWSLRFVKNWFPKSDLNDEKPFAPIFAAADQGYRKSASALSHISQNEANAPIIRASALERMNRLSDPNTLIAIARGVKNEDENIRVGSIRGAEGLPDAERWRIIEPLLGDGVLAVRSEAARVLIPLWQELSIEQQNVLTPALNDYLEIQKFNSDRGFAHANLANVFVFQSKFEEAESALKNGIRIDPHFANTYVNLADLYRQQNRENEALVVLNQGFDANPDNGSLPYSIGLTYIRTKQSVKASEYLEKATQVEPNNAQFHYVYGLSVEPENPNKAQFEVGKAYQIGGNPQILYALCEMKIRYKNNLAQQCIDEFRNVGPLQAVQQLERHLKDVRTN